MICWQDQWRLDAVIKDSIPTMFQFHGYSNDAAIDRKWFDLQGLFSPMSCGADAPETTWDIFMVLNIPKRDEPSSGKVWLEFMGVSGGNQPREKDTKTPLLKQ